MAITGTSPTPEIVRAMMVNPGTGFGTVTATGTSMAGLKVQRIPVVLTSTANGTTNWLNPSTGTVMAMPLFVITTAGTGTFDMGRGTDGTGNANGIIDGGTLTVAVHSEGTVLGTAAASATVGAENRIWWLVGPGGTGTNNSINVTHSDTPTSTMAGYLVVCYYDVQ